MSSHLSVIAVLYIKLYQISMSLYLRTWDIKQEGKSTLTEAMFCYILLKAKIFHTISRKNKQIASRFLRISNPAVIDFLISTRDSVYFLET